MKYPQVYIGKIEPYDGSSPSAIGKRQVEGGIMLTSLGLEGMSKLKSAFTAARIARYVTTHGSIMLTGRSSFLNRPTSSRHRPTAKISRPSA